MSEAATSLAAVAVKARQTELQEFRIPEIAPDSGLLRVVATGVCGGDWPMYLFDKAGPRILGHEVIGTIVKLGDIARAHWGLAEGDLVALEEYLPCGHCDFCRTGEYRSCLTTDTTRPGSIRYGSTPTSIAPGLWGGYSQYLVLHPRSVFHRVPPGVPPHIAAMALPIGNGFQWTYLDGESGPGKTVVIQGPGQQGLGCVIGAKASGAETIILAGLKRDAHRFEAARALGADHCVAVDEEPLIDAVKRITDGRLADLVIETTSAGPEIINSSLHLLRKRGTLILVSRKGRPVPNFDADRLMANQIVARGTRGHSYQAVELALKTMASGRFPLERMSSHVLGLGDVDRALCMIGGVSNEPSIHITVDPWK